VLPTASGIVGQLSSSHGDLGAPQSGQILGSLPMSSFTGFHRFFSKSEKFTSRECLLAQGPERDNGPHHQHLLRWLRLRDLFAHKFPITLSQPMHRHTHRSLTHLEFFAYLRVSHPVAFS
jgi:hypothetical protein